MSLLVALGLSFMRGFREVIGLAVGIVVVYLALNAIVIGTGVAHLLAHPTRVGEWLEHLQAGPAAWHVHDHLPSLGSTTGWAAVALTSVLIFPKLGATTE